MPQVNLFLLLPETEPTNQWMRSTETEFYEAEAYKTLIQELKTLFESIEIERYKGYYDNLNLKNFLYLYDTLDDCYPPAQKIILRSMISRNAFTNWREEEEPIQSPGTGYRIFNQHIKDNTFCEIAERKSRIADDNFALLNHHACTIKGMIVVAINKKSAMEIDNLTNEKDALDWFSLNRLPPRKFNVNPKHGENQQNIRMINNQIASPLRCSGRKAQKFLDTAIGESEKELYNLDPDFDEIIVFKWEGPTPQNMYHGYHVSKDSDEVPNPIRKRLGC